MAIDFNLILYNLSIWALPVLIAITLHEAAHGLAAWRLGDDTAYRLGRVTLNPLRHIDPVGTLIVPAGLLLLSGGQVMFGWAKPVPVNFARLGQPRRDMALVGAAGPGANFVLATLAGLLLWTLSIWPTSLGTWVAANLLNSIVINLVLAVFNLLPLPPLDGGRVAVGLLPRALALPLARLERWGLMIVLATIFLLPYLGGKLGVHLDPFGWLILRPVFWMLPFFLRLGGIDPGSVL